MQRTASVGVGALAFIALASGCWRGAPAVTPSRPAPARDNRDVASPGEASYRDETLAVDAVGIGLLAASTLAYAQRGGDDALSSGLLLAGGLTAALGAPIVHGMHGHGARAGASYLFRSMFVSVGMVAGMEVGCARDPGWLCGLGPEMGWGMVGGFVVAGALDALLLHDASSTWTPTMTPGEDGARVGVATTF